MADKSDQIFYDEEVIFHSWVMKAISYPLNESIWIKVCSWGLRPVLESFLLETEYQLWQSHRASAKQTLGERFLEDPACKQIRRSTDEQVMVTRNHWS